MLKVFDITIYIYLIKRELLVSVVKFCILSNKKMF